jgi:hypothetical protein
LHRLRPGSRWVRGPLLIVILISSSLLSSLLVDLSQLFGLRQYQPPVFLDELFASPFSDPPQHWPLFLLSVIFYLLITYHGHSIHNPHKGRSRRR